MRGDEFLDRIEPDRKDKDVLRLQRIVNRHSLPPAAEVGCELLRFVQVPFRDDDALSADREVGGQPRADISKTDKRIGVSLRYVRR